MGVRARPFSSTTVETATAAAQVRYAHMCRKVLTTQAFRDVRSEYGHNCEYQFTMLRACELAWGRLPQCMQQRSVLDLHLGMNTGGHDVVSWLLLIPLTCLLGTNWLDALVVQAATVQVPVMK